MLALAREESFADLLCLPPLNYLSNARAPSGLHKVFAQANSSFKQTCETQLPLVIPTEIHILLYFTKPRTFVYASCYGSHDEVFQIRVRIASVFFAQPLVDVGMSTAQPRFPLFHDGHHTDQMRFFLRGRPPCCFGRRGRRWSELLAHRREQDL